MMTKKLLLLVLTAVMVASVSASAFGAAKPTVATKAGNITALLPAATIDRGTGKAKTPTAVAGVIGTDFGSTSSPGGTDFLCIYGAVNIGSADPNITEHVICTPGMTVTVQSGKAPTAPKPATANQIADFINSTEPAEI